MSKNLLSPSSFPCRDYQVLRAADVTKEIIKKKKIEDWKSLTGISVFE